MMKDVNCTELAQNNNIKLADRCLKYSAYNRDILDGKHVKILHDFDWINSKLFNIFSKYSHRQFRRLEVYNTWINKCIL